MNEQDDVAVDFKDVGETYEIDIKTEDKVIREKTEVLKNVSFTIRRGESVAILGANGAGKSTILRIMAGLLKPDQGKVRVSGVVGSLLDLGAGFHPELTGRENLRLNADFYKFDRREFEKKYESILAFAGIGKFIDVPVRCYSQGMYVRLAFSLAIHVDPEILLIDDCLSVGDDAFQLKSLDKALELKAQQKTIVFVTHNFTLARQLCERGIFIKDHGVALDGTVDQAISRYLTFSETDREHYRFLKARIDEMENYEKLLALRREEEKARWDEAVGQKRREDDLRWEKEAIARRQKDERAWDEEFSRVRAKEEADWLQEVKRRRDAEGLEWAVEVGKRRDADDEAWALAAQQRRELQEREWQTAFARKCEAEKARLEKEKQ
ncbi:MAG: ATP-binding cassette domain-containing protein [Candidatus Omnitrophota bacterium]